MYIADTGNNRIHKFEPGGPSSSDRKRIPLITLSYSVHLERRWNNLTAPVDIEVDDSGGVYVVDQNNHRIQKIQYLGGIF